MTITSPALEAQSSEAALTQAKDRLKHRDWTGVLAATDGLPAVGPAALMRLHALAELHDTQAMLDMFQTAAPGALDGEKASVWKVLALLRDGQIEASGKLAQGLDLRGRTKIGIAGCICALVLSGRGKAAASLLSAAPKAFPKTRVSYFLPACLLASETELYRSAPLAERDLATNVKRAIKLLDWLGWPGTDMFSAGTDALWTSAAELARMSDQPGEVFRLMKLAKKAGREDEDSQLWSAYVTAGRAQYRGDLSDLLTPQHPPTLIPAAQKRQFQRIARWMGQDDGPESAWVQKVINGRSFFDNINYALDTRPELLKDIVERLPKPDLTPIRHSLAAGRPVMLLSGHFAPTPIFAAFLHQINLPIGIAANVWQFRHSPDLRRLFPRIPIGAGPEEVGRVLVRAAMAQLARGQALFLAADVGASVAASRNATKAPDIAPRLAQKYGADIYWCPIFWTGQGFSTQLTPWTCPRDPATALRDWGVFLNDAYRRIYEIHPNNVYLSVPHSLPMDPDCAP